MRNRLAILLLAACALVASSSARAELLITFEHPTYTAGPGEFVDVDVFLTQTDGTTILTDEGLASYGIRLDFTGPSAATLITSNPDFDFENINTIGADFAEAEYGIFLNDPVFPTGDSIFLATFRFAGANGTTVLVVSELNPGPAVSNFVSGEGTNLDDLLGGPTTAVINPSVIPEPSTLALAAVGALALASAGVWRRRGRTSL